MKFSLSSSQPFLQKKVNFFVTLAAVATTVISWYNINSLLLILMVLCRLIDGGPVKAIKAAFTNKYFLAYLALFLVSTAGYFYTHDQLHQGRAVEKEATLVAVAFTLCGGYFADAKNYKQFMTAYCWVLFLSSCYCLTKAGIAYEAMPVKDTTVFFYHSLTAKIGQNAVFYTVYMIFGLLFLLSHPMWMGTLPDKIRRGTQIFLILFFIGIIILLSSKLLLVVLFLILISLILQRFIVNRNYKAIAGVIAAGLLLGGWLAFSNNFIKKRYMDLERGDISMVKQDKFLPFTEFNGATLRLLQWRFANEILRENHAWVYGVSPGDAQNLLNDKYKKADIYVGSPNSKSRGFLDYNFHNQYIETTVRSGFLGLAALLSICFMMILLCERWRTAETAFMTLTLLSICTVESFITLQHGVFAFVFMPLMLLSSPRKVPVRAKKVQLQTV